MITNTQNDQGMETFADEHKQLERLLERIQATLMRGPGHFYSLDKLFAELVERIQKHFAHEEQGGYYNEVVEQWPRLAVRAEQLQHQHTELLADVESIHREVRKIPDSTIGCRAIQVHFNEFAERCREHEASENRLIQEAYSRDVGAID